MSPQSQLPKGRNVEFVNCDSDKAKPIRREFPEIATLGLCNHASGICRTCIARHTESQLSGDGKWRRVQCLDCRAKQSKAQICKLVWKEDFKKLGISVSSTSFCRRKGYGGLN